MRIREVEGFYSNGLETLGNVRKRTQQSYCAVCDDFLRIRQHDVRQ